MEEQPLPALTGAWNGMPEMNPPTDHRTAGALALAAPSRSRELRVRPARRIDLVAHFSGAFDLAEGHDPGHAALVAYMAYRVAEVLQMGAEARTRVVYVGLLHAAGSACSESDPDEAAGWVAREFGLDEQVVEATAAVRERWDGRGYPAGRGGAEIPVETLCVRAAHWAAESADQLDHPLRARAYLQRAGEQDLLPLVGPAVAEALRVVLRDDATWLAVFGGDVAGILARLGVGEGKPSRRRVEESARAMGAVIDAAVREPGRSARIAAVAREVCKEMGFADGACDAVAVAALLLDIGQLGVPRRILEKPSILTVDEMELMRRHPVTGARLLEGIPGFDEVTEWVEQHHERPDGRGYPEMLGDEELYLPPRILAVADAYWALRAHRPYRPAHSAPEVLEILRDGAGRQFDADVVAALPAALERVEATLAADGDAGHDLPRPPHAAD